MEEIIFLKKKEAIRAEIFWDHPQWYLQQWSEAIIVYIY